MAALILICLSRARGNTSTSNFCEFQRRFYGYIIVDAAALIMCSGYFGWLCAKRKIQVESSFRGLPLLQVNPPRPQAQRNILL
ncbi:MAG TPA: hypothetical protein DC047_20265 [Blastocatellia bacterium]|nr:hypothetical protein [Blastocatellia bacterium]